MVRKLTLILEIILMAVSFAGNGGYRSPFAVGFGARQLGMGGATVANVNTSSSIFWNPAGLANVDRSEVQLFHMTLFMDTRYDFAALAYPTLSLGTFGIGAGDLSSGKFDRVENYQTIGEFSSRQNVFMFGYGFPLFKGLYTGMTVKGVHYDIAGYRDSGFGFDLGMIYKVGFMKGLTLGFKGTDIGGPSIKLNTEDQRYPMALRGGIAYENLISQKHSLMINFDYENTSKLGSDIYTGGEFGLNQMLFLRVGYMGDKMTFGGGVAYRGINIDYAFATMSDLESSHRLSLSYSFGSSIKEKRQAEEQKIAERQLTQYKNEQETERLDKVDRELLKAEELESEGKTYEAIESYYRVLALDVQNQRALGQVTILFDKIRQNIAREASQGYTDQLIQSQLDLGDGYFEQRQYDNAKQQFNLALILNPDNQHAKDRLVEIEQARQSQMNALKGRVDDHLTNGDYESALESVSEILADNPNDRDAIAGRDKILNMVESSQYLNEALKYFDSADYTRSVALADSALVLNPESEGALSLKRQLARYTADVTTLEDIKENEAHWSTYIQGMENYQAGNYKEAIRLWQSLQGHYPNNPNLKRNIDQAAERSVK